MKFTYHKDGTLPQHGEIFVFGSNESGIHGAGAARVAHEQFGAVWRVGRGLMGSNYGRQSYAIPTKDAIIHTLPIQEVKVNVKRFLEFSKEEFDKITGLPLQYFITRIGCGLAGFQDYQIAPLFRSASSNCDFPEEWKEYLE